MVNHSFSTRPPRSALHLLLLLLGESVVADVAVAAVGTGVAQLATALLCHLQSYVRVGPDEVDLLDHQLAQGSYSSPQPFSVICKAM